MAGIGCATPRVHSRQRRTVVSPGHEGRRRSFAPEGEGYDGILADSSSYEDFDAKRFGFVRLNQLALEHLMGARS
ncbi:hypothetical protein [Clavibacter michiganensis]|uniref:hypothetical protein n=1 Tax=Clavibacter michiganensis TaxID=28447 RepID=UPI00355B5FF9